MSYQEMMKVVECMEDDSMHKKVGTLQVSQLTMRVSIGSATHVASGPKRAHLKTKGLQWKKNHGMSPRSNASIMRTWDTLPRIANR
jgi:hypothetical protein